MKSLIPSYSRENRTVENGEDTNKNTLELQPWVFKNKLKEVLQYELNGKKICFLSVMMLWRMLLLKHLRLKQKA